MFPHGEEKEEDGKENFIFSHMKMRSGSPSDILSEIPSILTEERTDQTEENRLLLCS